MSEPLVDVRFLEKLESLTLRWQKSFNGLVGGHNRSQFAGPGQEFLDHRNFHPGDDLRAVNWRAYMRFEKFFLKTFQVEPRVPVRLLLDVSASMALGGGADATKFDYARKLSAALIYIGLVRLDSIMLQPFAKRLLKPLLCSGGRHRFQPVENYLRALANGGETSFHELARQFLGVYPQRGLTVIVSDFLEGAYCAPALQYIADFGHELLLVHLWTEEERAPTDRGELDLIDAESGERLTISIDDQAARRYTEAFDNHAESLRKLALRNGGRYVGLSTRVPVDEAIFGPMTIVQGAR
jgi:uncharacterized protein (DUF58 family)